MILDSLATTKCSQILKEIRYGRTKLKIIWREKKKIDEARRKK